MPQPPGSGGLNGRLEAIERRLDELSRRSSGHGAPIASADLTAAQGTVTFDNLPQHYHHLQIVIGAGHTATSVDAIRCRFNGATRGYDVQFGQADGGGLSAGRFNDVDGVEIGVTSPSGWTPNGCTSTATIASYAITGPKFTTAQSAFMAGSGALRSWHSAGYCWGPQEPITTLTIFPGTGQFTAGTAINVYGLR